MQSASTERMASARSLDKGQRSSAPSLHPGMVIATRPAGLEGVSSDSSRICRAHGEAVPRSDQGQGRGGTRKEGWGVGGSGRGTKDRGGAYSFVACLSHLTIDH